MWKKRPYDEKIEQEFIKQGVSKLIARLLSQRSIKPSDFTKFSSSDYNDLTDPHTLNGVKEAADIFCNIVKKQGTVGVVGDFDVDGICSAVMLQELCNVFKLKCNVFLPSRFEHGYGLNEKSLVTIKERFKLTPDLLFITDCGGSNDKEIKELKEWSPNIKIIVIDHHIPETDKLSKSADVLINWHLQDNYEETCAGGEVFQFIRGIRWLTKKVDPIEFLSYAALCIVADVSPIMGNNRIIVKNGLGEYALKHVTAAGLNALLRNSGLQGETINQEDVSFKIAPRINAVGRLLKPDIVHKLLIEQDPNVSDVMAQKLNEHNEERKRIQKRIAKEAEAMVRDNIDKFKYGILVHNPSWQIGLVGLIASKLSETFCKPTLVFGGHEDIIKGSGRSFATVNLKEILDSCSDLFVNYGGHSMAAGAVLKPEMLDGANEVFNRACQEYYDKHGYPEKFRYYDVDIATKHVTVEVAKMLLDNMYPYCAQSNPEPVFLLRDATIVECELRQKETWRMLIFYAAQDGKKTELQFRMFNDTIGTEINGTGNFDIFFTFPQSVTKTKYGYPSCSVVDFVRKN